MKKHKHKKDLVFFAVILILVLVILYSGLRILESTVLHRGSGSGGTIASKTIEVDGVSYFPRQDITVVLLLGIDRFGPVESSGHYTNTGAADVDVLMIFDQTNQVVNMLYLNRDTMLTMPVLGVGSKPAGTYYGQLALAHTYGDGLTDSCENSRKAISDFLYGLTIDYYVSMNMDAIALLNDAVGGVTVEVTEDFSLVDPTIGMGTVKLTGQQALNFVRTRKDVGDQLNMTRMERQMTYICGFSQALKAKHETDATFVVEIYEELKPYVVTDCSGKVLASLLERYATYELGQILTPKGENVMGEKYYEFHVNPSDLQRIVLELLYAPKR